MTWYLLQTKPRSEFIALENLSNQSYECYLPLLKVERLVKGEIDVVSVPLFPRYLFIKLDLDFLSKSWGPIRSTRGVSQLVKFGSIPAKVHDELIHLMRTHEIESKCNIKELFTLGQSIKILSGPFLGFESIYQGMDPQMRVIVLLDFMSISFEAKFKLDQVRAVD
jgi:transcriptional antiterminator RfaH